MKALGTWTEKHFLEKCGPSACAEKQFSEICGPSDAGRNRKIFRGGGQGRRGYGYCRGLSLGCANVCGSKEGVYERDPKLNIMTSLLSKIF